jgi:hypothetical protein
MFICGSVVKFQLLRPVDPNSSQCAWEKGIVGEEDVRCRFKDDGRVGEVLTGIARFVTGVTLRVEMIEALPLALARSQTGSMSTAM